MAFFASNYNPQLIGVYDNELLVTYYEPNNNGLFLGRDSLQNVQHAGGNPESHPTLNNVIRNTNGHVFLKGSFTYEWSWNPGDISEADIDAYIQLISPDAAPTMSIQKDMANNKLTFVLSDSGVQIPDWTGQIVQWHPRAPVAKLTMTSDISEFVCVSRLNGTYHQYTFDQRTLEPDEQLTIARPECNTCYVMFSDHVLKGTSVLLSKKLYKLTSESITITNNNTDRIKIMRYYK